MRERFRIALRHAGETVQLELDHPAAGWTMAGEFIVCFDGKAVEVERIMHDLAGDTTYALLRGVLYDHAAEFVGEAAYLREQGWTEVQA